MMPLMDTLRDIAASLVARQQRLATAESCTGGGLAYALTSIPGSSDWYEQGWVTYSNAAKTHELDVPDATLASFGAVSAETASAMIAGIWAHSPADLAMSVTGIAGPSGGSSAKPVGLVWFAWGERGQTIHTESKIFSGDRIQIREQAILYALQGFTARYVP